MRTPGPALRAGAAAAAIAVVGFAVVGGLLEWRLHRYDEARSRATATTLGTVTEDGIGDDGDIRVRWTDAHGAGHSQRFGVYDTDRYVTGARFPIAYDPGQPAARGYPADPQETAAEDDITVPQLLVAVGSILLLLNWTARGILFRRTSRRPGLPALATVLAGAAAGPALRPSRWLLLAAPEVAVGDRWQRVMWHPALDAAAGSFPVTVHGPLSGRHRVVVQLAGGTRLVPVGRLRRGPPHRSDLREARHVRSSLADAVILPAGAAPPALSRWRAGLVAAAAGAAVGTGTGLFAIGAGPVGLACFAVLGTVVVVNLWALAGASP